MLNDDRRKSRGRPPVPDEQRRSERIQIYLTPVERERTKWAATVNHQSTSDFIRDVLVDGISETLGDESTAAVGDAGFR
jgi:hypothetical protein